VASSVRFDDHIRPIYDDSHLRPAPPPVRLSCYALSAGHATDRLLRASMVEDPCAWQKSRTESVVRRTICEFQMPAYSLSTLHRAEIPTHSTLAALRNLSQIASRFRGRTQNPNANLLVFSTTRFHREERLHSTLSRKITSRYKLNWTRPFYIVRQALRLYKCNDEVLDITCVLFPCDSVRLVPYFPQPGHEYIRRRSGHLSLLLIHITFISSFDSKSL
jgi:hypothetical protein